MASTYHHGDLRGAAARAAVALVDESGIDALTLRGIAARARVSHPALYQHFPDKEAVLEVVAEEAYLTLRRRLRSALRRADPAPTARLRAIGRTWVRFGLESPALFEVAYARTHHPREDSAPFLREPPDPGGICRCAGCRDFLIVVEEVAKAQRAGAARSGHPWQPAQLLVCLAVGYVQIQNGGRGVYRGQSLAGRLKDFDRLLDALLEGLRPA